MKITLKDNGIYGDGETIAVGEKNEDGSVTWIEGRLDFANRFCPFAEPKAPGYFDALCEYIRGRTTLDLVFEGASDWFRKCDG